MGNGSNDHRGGDCEQTFIGSGVAPKIDLGGGVLTSNTDGLGSPHKVPKAFNLRQPFGKRSLNR